MRLPYSRCSDSMTCFVVFMSPHVQKLVKGRTHKLGTYGLSTIILTTIESLFQTFGHKCLANLLGCLFCSGLTPIVASNSVQVISSHADPPMEIYTHSPTIESFGFYQRCAESNVVQLESRWFKNVIIGSGQTFPNASKFHDAVYLMSLVCRFWYSFNRNSPKHMTIVCIVD